MTFKHRSQDRAHSHHVRRISQRRSYSEARSEWARHYAANATLQLHVR